VPRAIPCFARAAIAPEVSRVLEGLRLMAPWLELEHLEVNGRGSIGSRLCGLPATSLQLRPDVLGAKTCPCDNSYRLPSSEQ
jgi:hypothetical protein